MLDTRTAMTHPQPVSPAPRIPRSALLRFGLLVVIVLSGVALMRWTPVGDFLTREGVLSLLSHLRQGWWAPPALILAYAVASPLALPISPLMLGGGAVFGAWTGSLYNIAGAVVGATLSYFAGTHLGRELLVHIAGPRLRRAELIFQKQSFWPLVQVRFIPIPFAAVNYGAALAGVPSSRFLLTSVLGLIPSTVVHTYFAATLIERPTDGRVWAAYGLTLMAFNLLFGFQWIRERLRRRRRYRQLLIDRSRRR